MAGGTATHLHLPCAHAASTPKPCFRMAPRISPELGLPTSPWEMGRLRPCALPEAMPARFLSRHWCSAAIREASFKFND